MPAASTSWKRTTRVRTNPDRATLVSTCFWNRYIGSPWQVAADSLVNASWKPALESKQEQKNVTPFRARTESGNRRIRGRKVRLPSGLGHRKWWRMRDESES